MKKNLLQLIIAVFGLVLVTTSCESDKPEGIPVEQARELNERVYSLMADNYLFWDYNGTPDYSAQPEVFLNSIKNKDDQKYSSIYIPESTGVSHDIGFEYGINKYQDDKTYYVIYYVKKGSNAESEALKRGYIIVAVGVAGEEAIEVNSENASTLMDEKIQEAIGKNKTVTLLTMMPPASNPVPFSVAPQVITSENPVYAVTDTVIGDKRIGYMLYNMFDTNYNNNLIQGLTELRDKNINNLVLDLRYNGGGAYAASAVLGTALVKQEEIGDKDNRKPFIIFNRRQGLSNQFQTFNYSENIPDLGDQLDRIFVIIGQSTSATSNTFINSLKAFWGDNLILVGEEQYIKDKKTKIEDNIGLVRQGIENWVFALPTSYIADKNLKSDYPYGFIPKYQINDVSRESNEMLKPLGRTDETIYKFVIETINGGSIKSASTKTDSYAIPVSILNKRKVSYIDLNDLND